MLWGNVDYPSGNQKPLFANTSNTTSNSTINGTAANTNPYYGLVMGVSATEIAAAASQPYKPAHAGWVKVKIGQGPIVGATVSNAGTGINAAGFIIVTDTATDTTASGYTTGSGANISYTIANTQNTLQAYSTNPTWNGVGAITVNNGGSGYSNASKLTFTLSGSSITAPSLSFNLGGRAGRYETETLIAMGSISGDAPSDNAYFSGV